MKTLATLFPKEKTESVDADLSTPTGRSAYFSECWQAWNDTEVTIPHRRNAAKIINNFAKDHNLAIYWDFLRVGKRVRFKDSDMAFYFRLGL